MNNYKMLINWEKTKVVYVVNEISIITNQSTYYHNTNKKPWREYLTINNLGFDSCGEAKKYCENNFTIQTIKKSNDNEYMHEGYIIFKVIVEDDNIIELLDGSLYLLNGTAYIDK